MLPNSKMAKAVRFALISGAATAALATPVVFAASEDEQVERIEVTGSRIKRTDMENATPITVLSADDMAKQGFTNIQDALQSLTSTTSAMTTQSVHGFTPAASSISLRNAGANRTLTLINGKRLNQYPKPSGGTDNFVDTANLPMEAVARIEVLKSGGSAIYGADAVGGVINIILKKDFDGVALKYRHGGTSEGGGSSNRVALSLGASSERGNVSTFIEFTDNEQLKATDRENFGLHTDKVSHSEHSSYSSYGARIAGVPRADKTTPTGQRVLTEEECTAGGFLWTGLCGYDRSKWRDLQPESTRFISSTNFNYELADDVSFVGRLDFAEAKSTTNIEPMGINDYGVNVSGNNVTVSSGSLSKTFDNKTTALGGDFANAEDGKYTYIRRLHEFSNRSGETKTRNYFFTAGLEGVVFEEYNWDASVNYGRTNVDVFRGGYATEAGMFDYITAGTNGNSLLKGISAEDVEAASYSPFEKAQSTQKNVQANISGTAFEMSAGEAMFSFGAEYTEQDYKSVSDSESAKGNILTTGGSSGAGDRSYWATYAELSMPVLDQLTVDFALRYDEYSDFGGNVSPQVTIQYRPMDELLVRASATSVFRAPDMHRVYGDATEGSNTVIDFKQCQAMGGSPGQDYPIGNPLKEICNELHISTTTGANADLEAETGYTANIGAVWGDDSLNASFDLWEWKLDDMVSDISADKAARDYDTYEDMLTRDANGTITHINAVAMNLAYQKVRGIDFTAGYAWDLNEIGELKLNFQGTYILLSEGQTDPTASIDDDIDDGGLPQYRANLVLGYFIEDFEATLGAYHTARMHGSQYKSFKKSADDAGKPFDESAHEVASQTEWNLTTGYNITDAIKVQAGVINLFDAGPNFDPTNTSWPHYPRGVYDARGREYFIEGEVKF